MTTRTKNLYCYRSHLSHRAYYFFFFNDTATTEIYTLSLHDALPICARHLRGGRPSLLQDVLRGRRTEIDYLNGYVCQEDRKSTRLNSSHGYISYAVFCLKKKKKYNHTSVDHHANLVSFTLCACL